MAASSTTQELFPGLPESPPANKPASRTVTEFPHLWLCIHLPRLALETLNNKATTGPLVVVDGEGSHCVVHVADQAARRQGIHCGLGLNAAYALCPQLRVAQRNADSEDKQLRHLALWATEFTPWVHVEQPSALLLEVRGSLRLFSGAKNLCARINSELDALHHYRQLALAPTPLAALWLARAGQGTRITEPRELPGQLGKLPLYNLGWPAKTIASLHGMGVYSVRDCLLLPRDGFARRFGKRYLQQLDRALGRLPDPRPSFIAPQRFTETIEMPAETTSTEQLSIAAERLLTELSHYLVARQAGIQNIELRLLHAEQAATCLQIGLLEDGQDSRRLLSLVRLKLESLALPAPVIALELFSGKVTTLARREQNLFSYRNAGDALSPVNTDWPGLLENLQTKLGVSAVFSVTGVADHRPELAWRRIEPRGLPLKGTVPACNENKGDSPVRGRSPRATRPLWLLSQPQRLTTISDRPDYDGPLLRESGPERIETGWWDGDDIVRDYYIVRDPRGLRLWIYRERRAPHDWYLHGYFA